MMTKPKPPAPVVSPPDAVSPTGDAASATPVVIAIPDPIVAIDGRGVERPLSGGSFIRVGGKLVRKEA